MIWLAVETSTALGSIAAFEGTRVLGERTWTRQGSHSEFVTESCRELLRDLGLEMDRIERVAVGVGPGSFTGIRVAVNFARTLAYVQQIPVFALDSLALTAIPHFQKDRRVNISHYAFRDLIYTATYKSLDEIVVKPCVKTKDEWLAALDTKDVVIGTIYENFLDQLPLNIRRQTRPTDYPTAGSFHQVAVNSFPKSQLLLWNQVVPLYIRASEAEEKMRQGLLKPL